MAFYEFKHWVNGADSWLYDSVWVTVCDGMSQLAGQTSGHYTAVVNDTYSVCLKGMF